MYISVCGNYIAIEVDNIHYNVIAVDGSEIYCTPEYVKKDGKTYNLYQFLDPAVLPYPSKRVTGMSSIYQNGKYGWEIYLHDSTTDKNKSVLFIDKINNLAPNYWKRRQYSVPLT